MGEGPGDPLHTSVGLVPIERDAVAVHGPDAEAFLQGQLSQDVAALAPGAATWSLLLDPAGKVVAWLRASRTAPDAFVLDVEGGCGELVVGRLERFKLRTRCTIEARPGPAVAVRGPASVSLDLPGSGRLPIVWPGVEGFDLYDDGAGDLATLPRPGPDALEELRIEAGVPRTGAELTERTIPAEAGQWLIDAAVSFTKGCYTGQELVARIDSRGGNVPRRLRGVVVGIDGNRGTGGDGPPPGAELRHGDRAVGSLTSVVWSPARQAPIALAFVARAVEPPAEAHLVWSGGEAEAQIVELPMER